MDLSLKDREDMLWTQYAASGTLPAVPDMANPIDTQSAHQLLAGDYNQLQKLLYGESLARKSELSAKEKIAHVEAARWVWRIANSRNRGYENKVNMSESLAQFKSNSRNDLLALVAGLEKGAQMLKDASEDKKVPLANSLANRLVQILPTHSWISNAEEFIRLVISIGWTFAKINETLKLKEVIALLPDVHFGMDDYVRSNIAKLKDKLRFAEQEPIRAWFKDVKAAEESCLSPDVWVPEMLRRAILFTASGLHMETGCVGDGMDIFNTKEPFDIRKMVLLKVTRMVGRFKNGIPTTCASAFLQIMKNDGLKDLAMSYYERRKQEQKTEVQQPTNVKTEWPSLAEDIAKMISKAGKVCFGHKQNTAPAGVPDLEWAIVFLETVYRKFPDDEWADYRLGKLFVWSGDRERGKGRILPVVRKKQTEYWAWDLLGDLLPEKRKCCVARALACNADEKYTKSIRQESVDLGIEALPKEDRDKLIAEANDLLIEGLAPHHGIVIEKFKNKEGKRRLLFSTGDGVDIMPVSPNAVSLEDIHVGMPVDLYWEDFAPIVSSGQFGSVHAKPVPIRIIAAKYRTGEDWDVLAPESAVFLGSFKEQSGSIAGVYADNMGIEFVSRLKAGPFSPGDSVSVYYKDVKKEDRPRECVWIVAATQSNDFKRVQLPQADVVYYGLSQKGTSYQFSSGELEVNMPIGKFPDVGELSLGDAFRITYSKRVCEDKELHRKKELINIQRIERIDSVPRVIKTFVGRMRMPNGVDGPGFVDDVFIPSDLHRALMDKNGADVFVEGTAVRLPPKRKIDRYGIAHMEPRSRAIELHRVEDEEIVQRILDDEARAEEEREEMREERERRDEEREGRGYKRTHRYFRGRW